MQFFNINDEIETHIHEALTQIDEAAHGFMRVIPEGTKIGDVGPAELNLSADTADRLGTAGRLLNDVLESFGRERFESESPLREELTRE